MRVPPGRRVSFQPLGRVTVQFHQTQADVGPQAKKQQLLIPMLKPDEWQARLEAELARAQDELASAAMARSPDPFVTVIDGKRGTNPVYDRWRFLKALIRGEKFSAAHSDIKKD